MELGGYVRPAWIVQEKPGEKRSPLKNGALSGKYTRENAGQEKGDRGFIVEASLGEQTYVIVDELIRIAREADTTPASVALAWVRGRSGVTSTLIGARNVKQLEQNLASISVQLNAEQVRRLDALSQPQLGFPTTMLAYAGSFMHGGVVVNGDAAPPNPLAPTSSSPRF